MKTTVLAAGALLLTLASCGKDQVDDTATDTSAAGSGAQGSTSFSGPPGASGEVADVSGRTMQVQNATLGQVAVTWTTRTTFSQQVAASLKDVSVGDCVMVTSDSTSASSATDAIAADSVRITPAADGQCTPAGGPGSGPGQLMTSGPAPEGMPSGARSGAPSGMPSGAPQRMDGAGGAFGTVTAVTATGFTVDSVRPPASGSTDTTTASIQVTVTDDTSYTTTAKATSAAVKVGVCVDARGAEDSTGAVTADTVAISPKTNGQCGSFGLGGPVFQQGA